MLATSLNEMAEQLSNALASLRSANWQLKKDIEREREQEKPARGIFHPPSLMS